MKIVTLTVLLSILCFLCGCERKNSTRPPVERVGLVIRFFKSMEEGNSDAAVRQGHNIHAFDRSQNNVRTLIHLQESNEAIVKAQHLIDQGKIQEALKIIEDTLKHYPDNNTLENARSKLRQLRNAKTLLLSMNKARSFSAMSSARSAVETGLSQNITPQLQAYLDAFKVRENKRADFERRHTRDSLEAATAAAEKAKAEDAAREAENLRFMTEMAEKTAIGEQMRKDAGAVPFETDSGINGNGK